MTVEKKNNVAFWAIGVLLSILISLVVYIWAEAVERIDTLEATQRKIEKRLDDAVWGDSLIIIQLNQIKEKIE